MSVANVAERLREIIQEYLPIPEDLVAYQGLTQPVPALSIVTITFTTQEEYDFYIKRVYVDAAAECTYRWTLSPIYSRGWADITLEGNEHEFTRRCVLRGGGTITLVITNLSVNDYTLDVIIDMWARPLRHKTIKEMG